MQNPRNRVHSLKVEIDEIKQKILVSSQQYVENPDSPSSLTKIREKEALISRLESLKHTTKQKKEALLQCQAAISKKLQSLAMQKQSTIKSKSQRPKYVSQAANLEKELQKVTDEYVEFSKIIQKSLGYSPLVEDSALSPMVSELEQVSKQHDKLRESLRTLTSEQSRMENTLNMLNEDIISQSSERVELILQRENLETELELIEIEYCDEIEYDEKEDGFILQMLKLKKTKEPILLQLNSISASIDSISKNIEYNQMRIKAINKELIGLCTASPEFEELKNLEEKLKEKCEQSQTEFLWDIVLDTNSIEGFDIDEEILKLQLVHMQDHESRLKQVWAAERNELEARISFEKSHDLGSSPAILELQKRQNAFKIKIASINQWKFEVKSVVSTEDNIHKIVPDSIITREFKSQFSSITYKEHKILESLMHTYLALLQKREGFYSSLSLENKLAQKAQAINSCTSLLMERPQLMLSLIPVKESLLEFENDEKALMDSVKQLGIVPNQPKAKMYMVKSQLSNWDDSFQVKTERIGSSNQLLKTLAESLSVVKAEVDSIQSNLESVSCKEFTLSSQVEEILERKRADMLSSLQELQQNTKNPDELKLYEYHYKVVEASVRLERAGKELRDFDQNILGILGNIELEESALKKQQQEMEKDLKEIQGEEGFIKDYEEKIKNLDKMNNTPLLLEQCRSPIEEFYRQEIRDIGDGGIIEGAYLEFVEKNLGRQAANAGRALTKKYYRIKLEHATQEERAFFEKIMPLLEGAELYKKLQKTDKRKAFNPLEDVTPEACGYAIRHFRLHKSLEKIEIKQPMKPGFDMLIKIETLLSPSVSKSTNSLLHSQGHDELEIENAEASDGFSSKLVQFRDFFLYPFSFVMMPAEKIEVIAKDYLTFKHWINGINALIKYKKRLSKLKTRIESYTSV